MEHNFLYNAVNSLGVMNKNIVVSTMGWIGDGCKFDEENGEDIEINLEPIESFLIQETGRFVEYRQAELLDGIVGLIDLVEDRENRNGIICFGLHKSGVDNEEAILEEFARPGKFDEVLNHYRKIYVASVKKLALAMDFKVDIVLAEVSDCITEAAVEAYMKENNE